MKPIQQKAVAYFRSGLNCSQSIARTFTDIPQIDESLILGISCGFGGGMGRQQETCGAVTGAYMVLGIHNSERITDIREMKEATYSDVLKFSEKFKSIHNTTNCRALLNCDISTEEGRKFAHDHNLFETVCEKCISDSAGIVEEMIRK